MGKPAQLRSLTKRLVEMGIGVGSALGGIMILSRNWLPKLFGGDAAVAAKVSQLLVRIHTYIHSRDFFFPYSNLTSSPSLLIIQVIVGLQLPLVALALIGEAFLVGCGFFNHLAWTSTLASGACAAALLSIPRMFPGTASVLHIWWAIKGLFVFRLAMVCLILFNPNNGPLMTSHYHDKLLKEEQRPDDERRMPPFDPLMVE